MKPVQMLVAAAFVVVGAWIWLRNPLGESPEDLWPALLAFPLYVWLARPWRWRARAVPINVSRLAPGVLVLVVGLALDHTLLLAVGLILTWRVWLAAQLEPSSAAASWKPMILLVAGFPWLALEGQAIGWWFRFSGAGVADGWFSMLGFAVERDGTFLTVQGMPLAVDAACSGLNALQSMLVAGTVLAWMVLPGNRYWWGIVLLPMLAWLANVLRIVTLGMVGLSFGPEAAMGWFHDWGGWAVLMVMFVLCSTVFNAMARTGSMKGAAA